MALSLWSRFVKGLSAKRVPSPRSHRPQPTRRLTVELLESRMLLSGGPGPSSGSSSTQSAALVSQQGSPGGPAILTTGTGSPGGSGSTSGGGSGNSGPSSLNSGGPGYPLPPVTGPTLGGQVVAPSTPVGIAVQTPCSSVNMIPVLLAGSNLSGAS
jgi:hypothetical protein